MSTRVLVTGSTGRVGRAVAAELEKRGYDVTGVDRRTPASAPSWHQLSLDLADVDLLDRTLNEVDVVVHLAALMSWDPADTDDLMVANVDATRALVQWASRQNTALFVLGSTGEVYPENHPVRLPIDEEHPTLPRTPYGLSKLLAEEIVRYAHRVMGLPSTILRFEHTQDAEELLDPSSLLSGPRFFLQARLQREQSLGNATMAKLLEPSSADGRERLLLLREPSGKTSRMPITETRDLVSGIVAAVERPHAAGNTIGLGPAKAVDFESALPAMAELTGLEVAEITVPGPLPYYDTVIDRARELLGYEPAWSFDLMIEHSARARQRRMAAHAFDN